MIYLDEDLKGKQGNYKGVYTQDVSNNSRMLWTIEF